jgi:hypothetical protein
MRSLIRISVITGSLILGTTSMLRATIVYTHDTTIGDFTSLVSTYATFSDFTGGDVSSPFTPTSTELAADGFRVFGGTLTGPNDPSFAGQNWFLATFPSANRKCGPLRDPHPSG